MWIEAVVLLAGGFIGGGAALGMVLSYNVQQKLTAVSAGLLLGCACAMVAEAAQSHASPAAFSLSFLSGFLTLVILEALRPHNHVDFQPLSPSNSENDSPILEMNPWKLTLPLMIHAAGDGLAVASASVDEHDFSSIILIAILLHKAPTAFAFVSLLLGLHIPLSTVKWHLCAFSVTAPSVYLATSIVLLLARENYSEYFSILTPMTLLFAAGSFIYMTSVHILQAVNLTHSKGHLLAYVIGALLAPLMLLSVI